MPTLPAGSPPGPGPGPGWPWPAGAGVLLVACGGYLAVRPMASLGLLLLAVALGLLVAAVGVLVDGPHHGGPLSPWRFLRAGAYAGGGLGVLAFTGLGVRALILAVGITLVMAGVMDLFEAAPLRGVEWWNAALGGLASVVFGVLALAWPDVSVIVIGVLVGVRLILLGFQLLGRALARARGTEGAARSAVGRRWGRLAGNAMALVLAVVLVLASLVLRRSAPVPDAFYTPPASVPVQPGQLLRAEPYTREIPQGASAWRVLYTTTRDEGQPAVASALVVVPTAKARDGIPVIAWAHGTTGAAPGCAPTVIDPFEAGAFFNLDEVLAHGWAFVGTDYVGLGTASPHPYLIGQGEGRSVLDSVRAAHQLSDVVLGTDTVVWGHSQGGHAALWTGILAPTYAPDVEVQGVAALAPASNLSGLVDSLGDVTGGELFASYVIDSYSRIYPDVTYGEYVRAGAQPIVRQMAGRCLAEKSTLLSVLTVLSLDKTIWNGSPDRGPLSARLQENTPTGPIGAPLLVGQGGTDTLVVPAVQDAYVTARCAAGQEVDYRTYPGRDHLTLVEADSPATRDLISWTEDRLASRPPTHTCS